MPKYKPWLKMWVEWVDDVKMLSLTLAEQGAWWRLCTLAQKCVADGALVKSNGAALSLDEIADAIRIRAKADRKVFDSMIEKMLNQGSLHWNSGALVITHFAERQAKTASETREAIRERVQRYREKHVTGKLLQPTIEKKESSKEKRDREIEAVAEVSSNGPKLVTSNESAVTVEAIIAEIANLYEQNIGQITPIISENLKEFADRYRGPISWIREAFKEAVDLNHRNWRYIERILERWQEEGFKSRKPSSSQARRPGIVPTEQELTRQAKEKGVL